MSMALYISSSDSETLRMVLGISRIMSTEQFLSLPSFRYEIRSSTMVWIMLSSYLLNLWVFSSAKDFIAGVRSVPLEEMIKDIL